MTSTQGRLRRRVVRAGETAIAASGAVTVSDVLVALGWLSPVHLDAWRLRGGVLVELLPVPLDRALEAFTIFVTWAKEQGLTPVDGEYVQRNRARTPLQFLPDPDPVVEKLLRLRWEARDRRPAPAAVRPAPAAVRPAPAAVRRTRDDLVVIWPLKDWTCSECGTTEGDLLVMDDPGPICLACADLDHLEYLPAGDAALTRRARAGSTLSAVVVRWSRSRRRYERQGLLVEEAALARAEEQCLADEDVRARRRERAEARRVEEDAAFHAALAAEIQRLFPGCEASRAQAIARHAGARSSGRVARTAAGRALDPGMIERAVIASIRHEDTAYDDLLMAGLERRDARERIRDDVQAVLDRWRRAEG